MQCSCGALAESDHKVVRGRQVVAVFKKCPSCGRIKWMKGGPQAIELAEIRTEEPEHE